ncbi:MAG: hypothetical protein D6729_01650, partial [Deltaproteobacteria bacterium]
MRPLRLLVPGPLDAPTGGSRYDRRLLEALRHLGADADDVEVPGPWPRLDSTGGQRLAAACARARATAPAPPVLLVDGLLAPCLPEVPPAAVLLLHMPHEFDVGLPPPLRRALSHALAER